MWLSQNSCIVHISRIANTYIQKKVLLSFQMTVVWLIMNNQCEWVGQKALSLSPFQLTRNAVSQPGGWLWYDVLSYINLMGAVV